MLILMAPLLVLYEGSILLASLLDRRAARAAAREEAEVAAADDDELHHRPGRRLTRCSSTSEAAAAAAPSRSSTSRSPLLMGGGLVLFGIGGDGAMQGGLVDAITGALRGRHRRRALRAARARGGRQDARQPAGRGRLGRARPRPRADAPASARTSTRTRRPTRRPARPSSTSAAEAWEKYLALDPTKPDDRVASLMVRAFDPTGLNRPKDAAAAQEIITEARPRRPPTRTLAIYAYQAGQTRKGDLARNEALELAPEGRAEHPQEPARPGQAAGARPADPAAAGLGHADAPRPKAKSRATRRLPLGDRALVAQLAEQRTLNPKVPGSIPGGGTSETALRRGFVVNGARDGSGGALSPLGP